MYSVTQVTQGFTNWKDGTVAFRSHEKSTSHCEAVEVIVTLPSTTRDTQLSQQHASQKLKNQQALYQIRSSMWFLGRQGLAIRGDGNESDGNLLQMKAEEDPTLAEWLKQKENVYTSLASFPGPRRGGGKGLVSTVCACA